VSHSPLTRVLPPIATQNSDPSITRRFASPRLMSPIPNACQFCARGCLRIQYKVRAAMLWISGQGDAPAYEVNKPEHEIGAEARVKVVPQLRNFNLNSRRGLWFSRSLRIASSVSSFTSPSFVLAGDGFSNRRHFFVLASLSSPLLQHFLLISRSFDSHSNGCYVLPLSAL
jgi:hypothetical protein